MCRCCLLLCALTSEAADRGARSAQKSFQEKEDRAPRSAASDRRGGRWPVAHTRSAASPMETQKTMSTSGECGDRDEDAPPVKKRGRKQCSENGCGNQAKKQGRCDACHRKATGNGRPQCSENDCNNEAHKQGRCVTCHRKATGEEAPECSENGCNSQAHKKGRCKACHRKATGEEKQGCSAAECNNEARKQGRCWTCHTKATGEGRPKCIEGCGRIAMKQGRCTTCHRKATGEEASNCSESACNNQAHKKGRCKTCHLKAIRTWADPEAAVPEPQEGGFALFCENEIRDLSKKRKTH